MKYVESNAELKRLHSAGKGLIYNDFSRRGSSGKNYNVLHAASCHWLAKSNVNVPKIFFGDIDEAIGWLRKNRGENWKRCGSCLAKAQPSSKGSGKSVSLKENTSAEKEVFTEGEVEQLLIQYLKETSYRVRRQVRVPSGIIDVVAEKEGKRLLIEAKGEDRGGYGTTEMNFQIGLGQLMSRMKHREAKYGLAFPVTKDFKKVLRKFKGSFAFEKLGVYLLSVKRDGSCRVIAPNDTLRFLEEMAN